MLFALWLAVCAFRRSYLTSLWLVPGPLLNSFTNLPLMLNIIFGRYHRYTEELHAKYGPIVRVGYNKVSVSDPAELKRILSTHDFRKGEIYKTMRTLPGTTFTTTNPSLNKIRRRQMGNSYSLPSVRLYEDKILDHGVLSLISLWDRQIATSPDQKKTRVNFYYDFHGMAFDIIGVLGFGKSFNILATGDRKMVECTGKTVSLGAFRASAPFGGTLEKIFRDWIVARKYLRTTAEKTIFQRKQENAESLRANKPGAAKHVDILQRLIDARDPFTGKPIEEVALKAEVLLMVIAGTDTTSNTLTWIMLCLLRHPVVYQRLKSDIRAAFPSKSATIRYDMARSTLPYLTAVIYEAMRLYPAVAGYIPRYVPQQGAHLMNGAYFLPQGTEVCISFFASHRNRDVWSNPTDFNPERFMGAGAEERLKDVLTFSSGVRICVGRHLAMVELYTIVANLILQYDFHCPDTNDESCGSVENIPGRSLFNHRPTRPNRDCWVEVSPAE
ncbi:hypothetical protein H4S06_000253 [Coemansia sp. BCRC 34490]|nr:hypothetical protein H4S06_000253 [Coemansia sp. BCRC 34490]